MYARRMNRLSILFCLLAVYLGKAHSGSYRGNHYRDHHHHRRHPDTRIIGGADVDVEKVPYQAGVKFRDLLFCGGVIISESAVATSGHCSDGWDPNEIKIVVGTSTYNEGGQTLEVAEIIRNPNYTRNSLEYDVSVFRLATNITLNEKAQPIPLADQEPDEGTEVTVSGWGNTREDGSDSPTLQIITANLTNRASCNDSYHEFFEITETLICTEASGRGTCFGDAGGPAVSNGALVGIISLGLGCSGETDPPVYVNVAHPDIRNFLNSAISSIRN